MTDELPFVSVIMPVRNEGACMKDALEAVLRQDYPADRMEVIAADGMSTDATRKVIGEFQKKYTNLKLIDNPGKIVSTGLNAAILKSAGSIIIRMDGHTVMAPDYVRACVSALKRSNADNVGGRMRAEGRGFVGKAIALATSTPFGVGGARFHYSEKEEWVDTVYLGAWKREIFEKIGLFDEEMIRNQDDEWNYRLRKAGGRILINPGIRSVYSVRESFTALWKQYFNYGFWKVRVFQKHPAQMRLRQFVPSLFVSILIGSALISLILKNPAYFLTPATIYLLADLCASLWISGKSGTRYLAVLPAVFLILHASYGAGFLWGILNAAKFKKVRVEP